MSKFAKILVTVGVIFIFLVLFGINGAVASEGGRTPGVIGIILLLAVIGAVKAIWKKDNNDNSGDDTSILQK